MGNLQLKVFIMLSKNNDITMDMILLKEIEDHSIIPVLNILIWMLGKFYAIT